MVRVSSPAKLRPWSELAAKMVMGVVPGLVRHPTSPPPKKARKRSTMSPHQSGGSHDNRLEKGTEFLEKGTESGSRKRGRRKGVASDFFPFSVFPFSSVSSVFFRFFFRFRFFSFFAVVFFFQVPIFSVFFRFFFSRFLPFHLQKKKKKTGRHRSRDPFCETPTEALLRRLVFCFLLLCYD